MFTTLKQVQEVVRSGQIVCWKSPAYEVRVDMRGQWFVRCILNDHCVCLFWADGVRSDYKPEDFYVKPEA